MRKNILIALVVLAAIVLFFALRSGKNIAIAPAQDSSGLQRLKDQQKATQAENKSSQTVQTQTQQQNNSTNQTANTQQAMELKIETSQQGTGDREVKAGDTVSVLYTGKLTDGSVFDASSKHGNQPFDFQVGAGMVIKGWDQGLVGAKVGEKRTLTIPGDLAYGQRGIPGVIPPNATLIFDVEVLSIK